MDAVNVRLGYTAPVGAKNHPLGATRWYLSQIDEVADAPPASPPPYPDHDLGRGPVATERTLRCLPYCPRTVAGKCSGEL
jgi:hypothetical protein